MDSTVLQIVVSLVTSGVTSAFISGHLAARREERDLLREKLEDLDVAVTRFCELKEKGFQQCIVSGNGYTLIPGKLEPEELRECDQNLNRMKMIISMYFPELDEALRRLYATIQDMKAGFTFAASEVPQAIVDKLESARESWDYDEANMHFEISKVARALLYRKWFSFKRARS